MSQLFQTNTANNTLASTTSLATGGIDLMELPQVMTELSQLRYEVIDKIVSDAKSQLRQQKTRQALSLLENGTKLGTSVKPRKQ